MENDGSTPDVCDYCKNIIPYEDSLWCVDGFLMCESCHAKQEAAT